MPELSGGVEAEVGEGVMLPMMIVVGTTVFPEFGLVGVVEVFGSVGVTKINGSSVGAGGSSEVGAIVDSSGKASVEILGSVPRKMYLKGVTVAVIGTIVREAT